MPKWRSVGFAAKQVKQPVSGLATLSTCLCAYAEVGSEMVSAGSFVLGEAMPPLTDALQEERTVFPPCILDEPQITQYAPGLLACLLSRSRVVPLSCYPSQGHKSPKLHSLSHAGCKTHKNQKLSPSHFPSQCLWGSVLLVHSTLAFLCNQGSLLYAGPEIHFLPNVSILPTFLDVVFSLPVVVQFVLQSSGRFLG